MKQFFKNWSLPITMLLGIAMYAVVHALQLPIEAKNAMQKGISVVQPLLIFAMLYLSFCKVDFKQLKWAPWHGWLLLIQVGVFALLALMLRYLPHNNVFLIIECWLACVVCPTATASVVIVEKLGGKTGSLLMYCILANLTVAFVVPIFIPLFTTHSEYGFWDTFKGILAQVGPVLTVPLVLARLTNRFLPALKAKLASYKDLAFYLWMVALALAMATASRAFMNTQIDTITLLGIMVVSLASCLLHFYIGRRIGRRYDDSISAGQALGQKNTIFVIWLSYTFMDPICAIAGGFYSIWHNSVNSWQLYRHNKRR